MHASVREYLLQLPMYSITAINSLAAGRCLAYLMSDDDVGDGGASESWSNKEKKLVVVIILNRPSASMPSATGLIIS